MRLSALSSQSTLERVRAIDGAVRTPKTAMLWGEALSGVKTRLVTQDKELALTFDACGSYSDGVDTRILQFLTRHRIPATLFISGRWIQKHPQDFWVLAQNPLFEIENHGANHQPASTEGRSAYGLLGTRSPEELYREVEGNARLIEDLTGRRPRFYRSGTAYYDPGAIALIQQWGVQPVGFSILGDAGATYSRSQVKQAFLKGIQPGAVSIMHMNHPERDSGNGLIDTLPELIRQGYRFVHLKDYPLI